MSDIAKKKLYTPDEIATMLGFHKHTIYRMVKKSQLPAILIAKDRDMAGLPGVRVLW